MWHKRCLDLIKHSAWTYLLKLHRALGKCAILWQVGKNSSFFSPLPSISHRIWTSLSVTKNVTQTFLCWICNCADKCVLVSGPPLQAGQEAAEWDCGAMSVWSRFSQWHGRQQFHPTDSYPCQQSWFGHRQRRWNHQTTAGGTFRSYIKQRF